MVQKLGYNRTLEIIEIHRSQMSPIVVKNCHDIREALHLGVVITLLTVVMKMQISGKVMYLNHLKVT